MPPRGSSAELETIRERVAGGRGRARCWSSAASRWRCAASTRAAASASCTTCSTWPAATNVVRRRQAQAVQATTELILARRPEVILELRTGATDGGRAIAAELAVWSACRRSPPCAEPHPHPRRRPHRRAGTARRRGHGAHGARAPSGGVPQMKILVSWSSGKDSAWVLHVLRRTGRMSAALLTTINEAADRVAMHGVRRRCSSAGGRRGPAARHRADSVAVPERDLRGAHGGGVPPGGRRRIHARRVRRSVSRGRAAIPGGAARGKRPDADLSALGTARRPSSRAR